MWPLLIAVLAAEPSRLLFVEAAGAPVTCTARDARGEARPDSLGGNGPWTWNAVPGDVVTCSAPGHEPIDIDTARAARRALAFELLPARSITLEAEGAAGDATVEWRALGEGGTSLLARQTLRLDGRLTLPVARAARVIRVRAPGAAPLSVLVPEGVEPLTLRLPPLQPGGELLVRWPAHAYLPTTLEASAGGARHAIEARPSALLRSAVLPAGTYAIVPRYRGGVAGPALRAVVRPGETAEVLAPARPEPGAARVSLAPEMCAPAQLPLTLQLRRDRPDAPDPLVEETLPAPPCQRDLEGLPAGDYEALVAGAGGSAETLSASRFTVLPGQRAEVRLAPSVRVVGRVTYGDESAAAGLTLRFRAGAEAWTAQTGLNGEYAVLLGPPGEYAIAAGSTSLTRSLQAGEQREDLRLGETRITVGVVGAGGARLEEAAQLVLTSSTGQRITGAYSPEGEEDQAQFVGLEHGDYVLTARTASGLTSDAPVRAQLTPRRPEARVKVVMGRHQGRLLAVDEEGRPVPLATASAGGRALEVAAEGGFPLGGVAVGEWLTVRAEGYTPVCRILQAQDLPEARLTLTRPSEDVTVHAPLQMAWESALLRGLPGSDCPVEIHDLGVAVRMEGDRTSLALRLPRGRFELLLGGTALPLLAPGKDVVLAAGAGTR